METHRLVLPEDLNQFGFLFGGRLLSWVDEAVASTGGSAGAALSVARHAAAAVNREAGLVA